MPTAYRKIAMIGAGAIGGVTAAFIERAGQGVELVCRHGALADKIRTEGLQITGLKGDHRVKLNAVAEISDLSESQELVFIATKAADCVPAAKRLIPKLTAESVVVSLQNGICEHALADVLGSHRVIGCVVGWGASHNGPGELEVTSEGEFVVGNIENQPDDRLLHIQKILNHVYPTRISNNIIGDLYAKLIVNACINSLGVIGGARLGQLLSDRRARMICIKLMAEAMAVADAMQIKVEPGGGGKLDYHSFLAGSGPLQNLKRHLVIRIIGHKYRRIKSSSLQSIERGRRTEVDDLNGYICDHGRRFGVPTPCNDLVRKRVKEIEAGEIEMSMSHFDAMVAAEQRNDD